MEELTPEVITCYNCDAETPSSESVDFQNQQWCQECIDDNTYRCADCEDRHLVDSDERYLINNTQMDVCYHCFNNNSYFTCGDCHDHFSNDVNDYYISDDDIVVCQRCFEGNNYFTCNGCSDSYSDGNYGFYGYCCDCQENEDEDHDPQIHQTQRVEGATELERLRNYRKQGTLACTLPDHEFNKGKESHLITNKRFMSVELEAEGETSYSDIQQALGQSFKVGSDGSLNNGVEVGTPPASGSAHVANVMNACKVLQTNGLRIERSCGLHVHIDLRDKRTDFTYLSHLFTTFMAVEDVLYAMNPGSRMTNSYCRKLRDKFKLYDFYGKNYINDFDYKYYKMEKRSSEEQNLNILKQQKENHYNDNRYNGINAHSVFYRGTLEVRIHAGSLNPIKILRWCEILQSVIEWTSSDFDYKTVEKLADMNVTEDKLKLMAKLFKWSEPLSNHANARITQFNHWGLSLPLTKGMKPTEENKIKKLATAKMAEIAALFADMNISDETITEALMPIAGLEVNETNNRRSMIHIMDRAITARRTEQTRTR